MTGEPLFLPVETLPAKDINRGANRRLTERQALNRFLGTTPPGTIPHPPDPRLRLTQEQLEAAVAARTGAGTGVSIPQFAKNVVFGGVGRLARETVTGAADVGIGFARGFGQTVGRVETPGERIDALSTKGVADRARELGFDVNDLPIAEEAFLTTTRQGLEVLKDRVKELEQERLVSEGRGFVSRFLRADPDNFPQSAGAAMFEDIGIDEAADPLIALGLAFPPATVVSGGLPALATLRRLAGAGFRKADEFEDMSRTVFHGTRSDDIGSFIREDGSLVLRSSENFEGRQVGVSLSPSQDVARDYASRTGGRAGPVRSRAQGMVFEIDSDALPLNRLSRQAEDEVFVSGADEVVIPRGKFRVVSDPEADAARTALTTWETRQVARVKALSNSELGREEAARLNALEIAETEMLPSGRPTPGLSEDIVAKHGSSMPESFPVEAEMLSRVRAAPDPERVIAEIVSDVPSTGGPIDAQWLAGELRKELPTPAAARGAEVPPAGAGKLLSADDVTAEIEASARNWRDQAARMRDQAKIYPSESDRLLREADELEAKAAERLRNADTEIRERVAGAAADAAAEAAPTPRGAARPGEPPPPRDPPTARDVPDDVPDDVPEPIPPAIEKALGKADVIVEMDKPGLLSRSVDKIPFIGTMRAKERPGIRMNMDILRAYIAATAEHARFMTQAFASRRPLILEIDEVFGSGSVSGGKTNVRFIGTAKQGANRLTGTLLDVAQNPHLYELTPPQKELLQRIAARTEGHRLLLVNEYGAKIGQFESRTGGIYLPNVDVSNMTMEVFDSTVSAASVGRGKTRIFESARERMAFDPAFTPETNVETLLAGLDNFGGSTVTQRTFKVGIGGKTRVQLVDELHPGLRQAKESLATRIRNIKSRIRTAEQQAKLAERQEQATATALRNAESRADTLLEKVDEIGDEFGPELSFLSGEIREIQRAARELNRQQLKLATRVTEKGQKAKSLLTELNELAPQLVELRRRYEAVNFRGHVLVTEGGVFRYFPVKEAEEVRELLKQSTNGVMRVVDEIRMTAFSGDFSPFTIQGQLGWVMDPVRTTRSWLGKNPKNILNSLGQDGLAKSIALDPQGWDDFAFWTGFPAAGRTSQEFASGLLGRLPLIGRKFTQLNEDAFSLILQQTKGMFETTVADLIKAGYAPDIAKATAGEKVTQAIPNLNPARLGQSPAQAAGFRVGVSSISFLRQPVQLMNDAARGYAKIASGKPLSAKERVSAKLMTNLLITMTAATASTAAVQAVSTGQDPLEAVKRALNPKRGWNIYIPFTQRYVPIGGTYRGFAGLVWPREVEGLPIPIPFGNALNFMQSRLTPGFAAQADLLMNEDFHGNTILPEDAPVTEKLLRFLLYELEAGLPLTLGSPIESARTLRTLSDAFWEGISAFTGQNLLGESPYRQRDAEVRRWAAGQGLRDEDLEDIEGYFDLSRRLRKDFDKEFPETVQAITAENDRRAALGNENAIRTKRVAEIQDQYRVWQLSDDVAFEVGKISNEEWLKNRQIRYTRLNGQRDELYQDLDVKEPENPRDFYFAEIDRLSEKYNGVMTGKAWDDLEEWVSAQSEADQVYIAEQARLSDYTPLERQYLADVDRLKPYWDLGEDYTFQNSAIQNVWDQYVAGSDIEKEQLEAAYGQTLRNIISMRTKERKLMRRDEPDVNAAYLRWYGPKTGTQVGLQPKPDPTLQAAADRIRERVKAAA